jgi:hypothetical protein
MVVKTRFRQCQRRGYVGVAEAIEAARLDEALGDLQDALGRIDARR